MTSSKDLIKAKREGAVIISNLSKKLVTFHPKGPNDKTPWVDTAGARFAAAQCRAESPHGGPWAVARLLKF